MKRVGRMSELGEKEGGDRERESGGGGGAVCERERE